MANAPRDEVEPEILDIIPERSTMESEGGLAWLGARMRLALTVLLGLAAIGATVITGWYIFVGGESGSGSIPIIAADGGAVKTRPEDPGGMQIPHQDMVVYERLSGEAGRREERVLPPPEEPVAPPPPAAPIEAPKPVVRETLPEVPAVTGEAPPSPLPRAEPPPPKVAAAPPPPPAPVPAPAKPAPAPAPEPAVAKAPPAGEFRVQLAAMGSEAGAQRAWAKISGANKDLLGSLKSEIIRADLGSKGIFYRLRAGPLTEAAARKICDELKKRNQGCIVAR